MGFFDTLGKIGSAISTPLSAIAGIGSSLISANSQKKANAANMRIAQMNNEWSERMMNKQHQYNVAMMTSQNRFAQQQAADANAFTEKMWNKTNEYNSAKNQAARLREAGLNPALVMSGQNAGSAIGASGVNGAVPSGNGVGLPSPASATMQPINYNGIGTAVNEAMQLHQLQQRTSAETNWMNTQSVVAKAKAAAEVAEIAERTRGHKFQNNLNEATESILAATRNEQYLNEVQKRLNATQQEKLMIQDGILRRLEIEAFPQRLAMDVAVMASQIDLNKFNAQTDAEKLINSIKKRGYKLSKNEEKAIFDALIQTIHSNKFNGSTLTSLLTSGFGQIGYIKGKY